MSSPDVDLDGLRRDLPRCVGLAWFAGEPMRLVHTSGEPGDVCPSWDTLVQAAHMLLFDGPVASPEVVMRWPTALVLLAARGTGVMAVVMTLEPAGEVGLGLAIVQARMVAQQVGW